MGVDALYSGDAERAVELFELKDRLDDSIREEAAYQAAVGGRLTLDCSEQDTAGVFTCVVPYHNAFTDAIGWVDSPGDSVRVVVDDGSTPLPDHSMTGNSIVRHRRSLPSDCPLAGRGI